MIEIIKNEYLTTYLESGKCYRCMDRFCCDVFHPSEWDMVCMEFEEAFYDEEGNSLDYVRVTEACLRKQIEKEKLIVEYVRDGLKRDGFL